MLYKHPSLTGVAANSLMQTVQFCGQTKRQLLSCSSSGRCMENIKNNRETGCIERTSRLKIFCSLLFDAFLLQRFLCVIVRSMYSISTLLVASAGRCWSWDSCCDLYFWGEMSDLLCGHPTALTCG